MSSNSQPPSTSFNNSGEGWLNANTGHGLQYNNNASGSQYISHGTQIINAGPARLDLEETRRDERSACIQSLSFRDMDARRQDIASAHSHTCDWVLQTDEFREWRERTSLPQHHGVLWIKGKPGTGKSTLMKHIFRYCQLYLNHYTVIAHFFNARGSPFEKSLLGMLRSLVCQLVTKEDAAYERFVSIFREKQQVYGPGNWEWRPPELKTFLLSEIALERRQPWALLLFADALDECSSEHVRDVVEFLEELSTKSIDVGTTLNTCLSSRHYPHINMKHHLELVVERMPGHSAGIAAYIRDKLHKRNPEIEESLQWKAQGSFMWVVLVVQMLNDAYDEGKVEAMHEKLRDVPRDLDALFTSLLSAVNPDKHETVLMLQLVLFGRKPLLMKQLFDAMLARSSASYIGVWPPTVSSEDMRRRITHSSRGLIEVRRGVTVQFIHESVIDFLLRSRRLQELDESLALDPVGQSHDQLKAFCVSYLTELTHCMNRPPADLDWRHLELLYPLLSHAAQSWPHHCEEALERGIAQINFIRQLKSNDRLSSLLREYYRCNHGLRISYDAPFLDLLLHHSVDGCHHKLAELLLEEGANPNAPGSSHGEWGTMLITAVWFRHIKIVTMLLEHGADVNAPGPRDYGNALQLAVTMIEGEELVRLLLAHGADVNVHCGQYGTALVAATRRGDAQAVRILLDHGADINDQFGPYGSALEAAALEGDDYVLRVLLERRAEISKKVYISALRKARGPCHSECERLLLT